MTHTQLLGVAALGLLGVAGEAGAQVPKAPAAPQRQIVRWPGGWMYLDAPGVIYHDDGTTGASSTVISDSGNGVGNKITVDTGDKSGVTILKNVRNGIGNTVTVTPDGPVIDISGKPVVPMVKPGAPVAAQPVANAPAAMVFQGRKTKFWTKKLWSDDLDRTVYFEPKSRMWFQYEKATDSYRPVPGNFDPMREKP